MNPLENHGLIIRKLRKLRGLNVRNAAENIGRSIGWLSEIENGTGTARLTEMEFDRIVTALDGSHHKAMFRTWVATYKKEEDIDKTFEGAVLRHIRLKKEFTLLDASLLTGLSRGYLCNLEMGRKPMTLKIRNQILKSYGYMPKSFKNFATDPVRSKVVPLAYKFKIWLHSLSPEQAENFYSQTLSQNL